MADDFRPSFASRQSLGIECSIVTDLETGETKVAVTKGAGTEEGKAALLKLLSELGLDGVKLDIVTPPEAHTHGPDVMRVQRSGQIRA